MRYINIQNINPKIYSPGFLPYSWKFRSRVLLQHLISLSTSEERKNFIDHNCEWRDIKKYFVKLSNNKCWFTESYIDNSYQQIEHFRPKKRVELTPDYGFDYGELRDSIDEEGYWWLSYEITNLRLVSQVPNTSKRSVFPLSNKGIIGKNFSFGDCIREKPMLLDPCNKYDVALLSFENCKVVEQNQDVRTLDYKRAHISIGLFNLNYEYLIKSRAIKLEYLKAFFNNANEARKRMHLLKYQYSIDFVFASKIFKDNYKTLLSMLNPKHEFTSMIYIFLVAQNEKWVDNELLMEAKRLKFI